jgi:hypothetical protein
MLARWAALAAAVLATGLLLFSLAGGFSYDRGMYLDVEGARLSGGKPYGHVYVVKMDRGLGPDRKLLITTELGVALAVHAGVRQDGEQRQVCGR